MRITEAVFALATGAVFWLLPYAIKDVPPFVAYVGMIGSVVMAIIAFLSERFFLPAMLATVGVALLVISGRLFYTRAHEERPKQQQTVQATAPPVQAPPAVAPPPPAAFDLDDNSKAILNRTPVIGVPNGLVIARNNSTFEVNDGLIVGNTTGFFEFPPPSGEYSKFSNSQLRNQVNILGRKLRKLENDYEVKVKSLFDQSERADQGERFNQIFNEASERFAKELRPECLALYSEMGSRLPRMHRGSDVPLALVQGADVILYKPAGAKPFESAAAFLEFVAGRLPQ